MVEEFLRAFRGNNSQHKGQRPDYLKVAPIFLFLAGVYDRDLMHSRKFELFSGSFSNFSVNAFPPPEYRSKP